MANIQFNIAKGRIVELYNRVESSDPANAVFHVHLLKSAVADSVLEDYDDYAALILAAGNVEADFTNYQVVTWSDVQLAALPAPDDTANTYDLTFPDLVYPNAGAGNTLAKVVICYDADSTSGTDASVIPLIAFDYTGVTDGSTITLQFPADAFSAA